MRLYLKMWFFTFFNITWYAEAAMHTKNLLFTHFIIYIQRIKQGRWWSKIDKVWHKLMEWKMLLDGSIINLSFFVILRYIERKWHLKRRLASILPSNSKLAGKFQRFNAIDGSIEMLNNSWTSKNSN